MTIDKACAHYRVQKVGADGVVAIGVLPLVTHITSAEPLNLKKPLGYPFDGSSEYFNTLYPTGSFYTYLIGKVHHLNLNLFTDLEPSHLKEVFIHFLQYAYKEGIDLGVENKQLTFGSGGDFVAIAVRLDESNSQFVFSNTQVLATFGAWAGDNLGRLFPNKKILASTVKIGMGRSNGFPCSIPKTLLAPVDRRALQPRVPIKGRLTHRERFCRRRVVRNEKLPDNPRRRPRNRQL